MMAWMDKLKQIMGIQLAGRIGRYHRIRILNC